jgi:hypothetical protein
MQSFLRITLLVFLGIYFFSMMAGCGHVDANYPVQSHPKSSLPTEFKTPDGGKTFLIWNEPGRVHGFLSKWRDTSVRADIFRGLLANSRLPVHRDAAKMYDDLSAAGIAEASIWAFFAKGVKLPCRTGDIEVEFADGTRVRDEGVLYVEIRDSHTPYRYSRESRITLSRDIVAKGEPVRIIVFLPKEYLNQRIIGVTYHGKG